MRLAYLVKSAVPIGTTLKSSDYLLFETANQSSSRITTSVSIRRCCFAFVSSNALPEDLEMCYERDIEDEAGGTLSVSVPFWNGAVSSCNAALRDDTDCHRLGLNGNGSNVDIRSDDRHRILADAVPPNCPCRDLSMF